MGQPQPTAGDCHRESHRPLGLSSQEGSCRVSTVARVVVPSGLGRAERASDRRAQYNGDFFYCTPLCSPQGSSPQQQPAVAVTQTSTMPISTPSNGTPKHGRLKTAFPTLVDDPNSTSSSRRSRGPNSIGDTRSRWRPRTVVSFSRWIQHVHVYYPGYSLTHTAEDVGDCCGRIDIQLERKDLPDDERQRLLLEKNTHLGAAVGQRRTVSKFVNEYVKQHAPDQKVPDTSQIEDFGGSFAMPHYGHIRPSADYFNSNLMVRNFVPADITSRVNNVIFYDERAHGKDAEALCSLRFVYHMKLLTMKTARMIPSTLLVILDNCVGQNKSQLAMMFFAMLSLLLCSKVILLYLIPGHSHNQADRVVAWCRNAMKGKNFYTPMDIVQAVNDTMAPVGSLTSEKLLSLPKKYFSIPPEYLPHYRAIASEISSQIEDPIQQTVPHPLEQTPACFD
ncbi:LOW QUALITY PROTEIN: uncharacterized protein LOC144942661 [Lampetra fluviatilis]